VRRLTDRISGRRGQAAAFCTDSVQASMPKFVLWIALALANSP